MPKISDLPSLMIGYDYPEPCIVANGQDSNDATVTGKFYFSDLFDCDHPIEVIDKTASVDLLMYGQPTDGVDGFFAMPFDSAVAHILPEALWEYSTVHLSELGDEYYVPVFEGATNGYQLPVSELGGVPLYSHTVSADEGNLLIYYEDCVANTGMTLSEYIPNYLSNLSNHHIDDGLYLIYYDGDLYTADTTLEAYLSDYMSSYFSDLSEASIDDTPLIVYNDYQLCSTSITLSEYRSEHLSEYMADYLSDISVLSEIASDSFIVCWQEGGHLARAEVQNVMNAGLIGTLTDLSHYTSKLSTLSGDEPFLMWNPNGSHDDSMYYITLSELKSYFNS